MDESRHQRETYYSHERRLGAPRSRMEERRDEVAAGPSSGDRTRAGRERVLVERERVNVRARNASSSLESGASSRVSSNASSSSPREAVERPREAVERPRENAGRTYESATRSRESVGRTREGAGRVREDVDRPRESVGRPRSTGQRPRRERHEEHDYGYVGGKPARNARESTPRVSGWTSNRRESKLRIGSGGRNRSRSRGSSNGLPGFLSQLNIPLIAIALVAVIVLVFAATKIVSCVSGANDPVESQSDVSADAGSSASSGKLAGATETTDADGIVHGVTSEGISYTVRGRGAAALQSDKVTLVAAGDQIGTDQVLELTDSYAGSMGDDEYDFMPFYQEVAPFIQQYDLRFINQETIMAGEEEYDFSGWPSFNTPDAAADAIAQVGFNLVNFGTNHTLDYSTYGVEESHELWDTYPQLLVTGSYASQEERDTVQMIERNGMTFALLSYCYGDNYLGTYENFPNSYCLAGFDKETMKIEIERARKVADVVIVVMHWGDEYIVEPNDQQIEYAKFLADLDVDLVLGTHAHIMQPTRYVTGESGNTVPVVFGLSDFVSGWTKTDYILSGLFTCDFTREEDGSVSVGNLAWHPTIEWSDGGQVYVRFLKDMDEATTNANTRTEDVSNDYTYLRNFIEDVGMEIPVVL